MTLKKQDFVEVEFTGRVKGGEIFDTTDPEEFKKLNPDSKETVKPLKICIGQKMVLPGLDDALEGKDIGKETNIELSPEKAFGPREPKLIKIVSRGMFKQHKIDPYPGLTLNLDNKIAKVMSVSGGRVSLDFNHPLAGKEIVYEVKINKQINELKEKVEAINEFLFRQPMKFEINEKDKKVIIKAEKQFEQLITLFAQKFKEILGLDLTFEELKEKQDSSKQSQ